MKTDTRAHPDRNTRAQMTYSALELGASETQTTCSEYCQTALLLLHHGEAVTVSPTKMHMQHHHHHHRASKHCQGLFFLFINDCLYYHKCWVSVFKYSTSETAY